MPAPPTRPLPTAAELERLAGAFRDNPRSSAFLPLAEAYLVLGRVRDAIDVLLRGLATHPDHLEARLALGRAYMALHQWKEAQAELLKVVKADRTSALGFRLLGEVLMRRADYERALPVLQHAQNLNPADPVVLAMLKRAREGRPLDPPPPLPAPGMPAAGAPSVVGAPAAAAPFVEPQGEAPPIEPPSFEEDPTRLHEGARGPVAAAPAPAPSRRPSSEPGAPALGRMPLERQAVRVAEEKETRRRPADPRMEDAARPKRVSAPPPPEEPFRPLTDRLDEPLDVDAVDAHARAPERADRADRAEPAGRAERVGRPEPRASASPAPSPSPRPEPRASAPPPVGAAVPPVGQRPAERPRVEVAPNKRPDAAAEAMRRSAAVGEDYLNQLLGGGLLSVPNVEARPMEAIPQGKAWGRSRWRAFLYLWIFALVAIGAGAGWYVYTTKKRDEAVAAHLQAAAHKMLAGRATDLAEAQKELERAIERDPARPEPIASLAAARALAFLLYGAGRIEEVDGAITAAQTALKGAAGATPGHRELAVARVARAAAILDRAEDPDGLVAEARADLDGALQAAPSDGLLLWLQGMLHLAAGERGLAREAFEKADAAGNGPAIARVSLGDLDLDEGNVTAAIAAYDAALARSPKHPLALVGRALARVERASGAEEAMNDLNVELARVEGTRLRAWKDLAFASVYAHLEDYEKARKSIDAAARTGLGEPRFVARVALAELEQGRILDAEKARGKIRTFGGTQGQHPLLSILDAELLLARGLPEEAIAALGDAGGLRARLARGRALLDAGRPAEALLQFTGALEIAPDDPRARAWAELARVLAKKDVSDAFAALTKLARGTVSTFPRYLLGEADVALGRMEDARRDLEASLENNPLGYRARVRLASVYLREGRPGEAEKMVRQALEQAPEYLPAHSMLAQALLANGKPAEAREELRKVVEAGGARAEDELLYAEALLMNGDKGGATEALRRAKEKGADPAEIGRIAVDIDRDLPAKLGVPKPR